MAAFWPPRRGPSRGWQRSRRTPSRSRPSPIEEHVLAPEALDTILANALSGLADAQVDQLAGERERLANVIAELDRKIRLTATHAINGMIDEGDARAITAPLLTQRDHARLQPAALPAADPVPEADTIDPDAFREAVREAWRAQPLEERRHALSRVVEKVELSPGGLEIATRGDPPARRREGGGG